MRSIFLLLAFFFIYFNTFSQGNNGLIAHWNFNGNANDVSGHGLNGIATHANLTSGYAGVPNTAYLFNGINSAIDVAYNPLLNLDSLSICFLIKPMGFYSGSCQGNTVLSRGIQGSSSTIYYIDYGDNPYDSSCNTYTLSHEVFGVDVHNSYSPSSPGWYADSDTIILNSWYCVVMTYDQDSVRMYVNGTLRNTVFFQDNYAPGTDSLSIGYSAGGVISGDPNWINGVIDDIRLYGRALSPIEVTQYCDTAQMPLDVPKISTPTFDIGIYPNPAHNNISIQIPGKTTSAYIQLFNALGQHLADLKPQNNITNMDISILPTGMYFIKASCEGQMVFKKFLKE